MSISESSLVSRSRFKTRSSWKTAEGRLEGDNGTFATLATSQHEITVELGSGDPGLQAALTYRKHIVQESVRDLLLLSQIHIYAS